MAAFTLLFTRKQQGLPFLLLSKYYQAGLIMPMPGRDLNGKQVLKQRILQQTTWLPMNSWTAIAGTLMKGKAIIFYIRKIYMPCIYQVKKTWQRYILWVDCVLKGPLI